MSKHAVNFTYKISFFFCREKESKITKYFVELTKTDAEQIEIKSFSNLLFQPRKIINNQ